MAGLGNYTIQPELIGGFQVHHDRKAMCKTYENEVDFKHDLQKHDWSLFFMAIANALAAINKLQLYNYYVRNASGAHAVAVNMKNFYTSLPKADPITQGRNVKYFVDMLPLLAATKNEKENKNILAAHEIIKDYYNRYLAKYESFNNSFLTA